MCSMTGIHLLEAPQALALIQSLQIPPQPWGSLRKSTLCSTKAAYDK